MLLRGINPSNHSLSDISMSATQSLHSSTSILKLNLDDGEQVPEPLLGDWERAHDVHMDVGKPLLRNRNRLHGGSGLAGNLGPGAGLAVLDPLGHVLAYAGPHHSLVHDPPHGLHPWVSHTMEGNSYAKPMYN